MHTNKQPGGRKRFSRPAIFGIGALGGLLAVGIAMMLYGEALKIADSVDEFNRKQREELR